MKTTKVFLVKTDGNNNKKPRFAGWIISAVGHLIAVSTVFIGFQSAFLTESSMDLLGVALTDEQLAGSLQVELAIILGLSACLWAFAYIGYLWIRESVRDRKALALVKPRGTVLTETLIIFPAFLLLTFGMAQMSVNSMAGLMATLANYEAARTIAVWGPEIGNNRAGSAVTQAVVTEKARVAAAGVMAPVAPTVPSELGSCNASNRTMDQMLSSMTGAGIAALGAPKPAYSFVDGLDSQTFAARGWIKLQVAFCRSDVTWTGNIITDGQNRGRNPFTTRLEYTHTTVFPLMQLVFGPYSVMEREYTLTQQISPNPVLPD